MIKARNFGLWVSSILGRARGTAPTGYRVTKQILNEEIFHLLGFTYSKIKMFLYEHFCGD
jgi:hypothetical protein